MPRNNAHKINPVMKTLTIGVEMELVGLNRGTAARAMQGVVGGTTRHVGSPSCYDPWKVTATDGRVWTAMADSSLSGPRHLQSEIVSPILRYEDIPTLQEVLRACRRAGGRADSSCGVHVHIGADPFKRDPKALIRFAKLVNKNYDLLVRMLGCESRARLWCRPVPRSFFAALEGKRNPTLDDVKSAWYGEGRESRSAYHYDDSRYCLLNLHNVWFRGTVECRAFNGTTHAGKVKAFVQLVAAMAATALVCKRQSNNPTPVRPESVKYDARCLLIKLGLVGDEFKTARLHLLANLEGDGSRCGRGTSRRAAA